MALAETPPAYLLAEERSQILKRISEVPHVPKQKIKSEERIKTIQEWDRIWRNVDGKTAWTRHLLPDLARWIYRVNRFEILYHMSQALTGHGCFGLYLFNRKRAVHPRCVYYGSAQDSAEHTLFICPQ